MRASIGWPYLTVAVAAVAGIGSLQTALQQLCNSLEKQLPPGKTALCACVSWTSVYHLTLMQAGVPSLDLALHGLAACKAQGAALPGDSTCAVALLRESRNTPVENHCVRGTPQSLIGVDFI